MASAFLVASSVPQLPSEIWRMVFGNFDTSDKDLAHLWLNYRHVSKLFREEVEYLFVKKFLSKASVWISQAGKTSFYPGKDPIYGVNFIFEQFSELGDQAVFRCSSPIDRDTDAMFEALKDRDLLRHVMKKQCHEVRIRKRVNEVFLPDLDVDHRERTVALDWRQLLSCFFAEEKNQIRREDIYEFLFMIAAYSPLPRSKRPHHGTRHDSIFGNILMWRENATIGSVDNGCPSILDEDSGSDEKSAKRIQPFAHRGL